MTSADRPAFIRDAVFIRGVMDPKWIPVEQHPIVLAAGRSNAGKSSLLNALCGRSKLARVSKTPGRTTEINFFLIDGAWFIADLPGYGFARRSRTDRAPWEPVIMALLDDPRARTILLAADIRRDPEAEEAQLADLAHERGVTLRLVLTKSDKLGRNERAARAAVWSRWTGTMMPPPAVISSTKGDGIADLRMALLEDVADRDQ